MTIILSLVSMVLVLFAFGYFKLRQASRQIDRLFKTNANLENLLLQQKAENQRKEMELNNAKTKRKNDEVVKPMPSAVIDGQLHAKGYFRANSGGVSGVQSDLSKSCGYNGNETSGAGS